MFGKMGWDPRMHIHIHTDNWHACVRTQKRHHVHIPIHTCTSTQTRDARAHEEDGEVHTHSHRRLTRARTHKGDIQTIQEPRTHKEDGAVSNHLPQVPPDGRGDNVGNGGDAHQEARHGRGHLRFVCVCVCGVFCVCGGGCWCSWTWGGHLCCVWFGLCFLGVGVLGMGGEGGVGV
jgi:hypothetical protein